MTDYEISAADAARLIRDKSARLIDVREQWEFAATRVEGSVLIPMGEIPARASSEFKQDERLVIMCHHGVRSMNVTAWLRNQGYEQAQSMRGGIDAWSREVDPGVARY
jgi:rhodanese-related sulfurtransferase